MDKTAVVLVGLPTGPVYIGAATHKFTIPTAQLPTFFLFFIGTIAIHLELISHNHVLHTRFIQMLSRNIRTSLHAPITYFTPSPSL
ncbi:hypothetical protein M378DRAFT_163827, partial [Amanita muscaria Koide BX008]